jgi:ribonuclease P protein component
MNRLRDAMNDRRFAFPRKYRVRRQNDFDRIRRRNVHAADQVLVVLACENGRAHPRLGLAVSRRVGNAVVRNRWKRWIREAFRQQKAGLPAGVDLLVRPRRGAAGDYRAIERSLRRLAGRVEGKLRRTRR